jgi:hypothetical protein
MIVKVLTEGDKLEEFDVVANKVSLNLYRKKVSGSKNKRDLF